MPIQAFGTDTWNRLTPAPGVSDACASLPLSIPVRAMVTCWPMIDCVVL